MSWNQSQKPQKSVKAKMLPFWSRQGLVFALIMIFVLPIIIACIRFRHSVVHKSSPARRTTSTVLTKQDRIINDNTRAPRATNSAEVILSSEIGDHGFPTYTYARTNTFVVPQLMTPLFSNSADQVLALLPVGNGISSSPPPPISANFEQELRRALATKITILPEDDEITRAIKERVIESRAQLNKLLEQGGAVNQVLREHLELANENQRIRSDAEAELSELIASGDIEGALNYRRVMNVALGQMGIAELTLPITEEERAERAALRRERMLKKRADQEAARERQIY